MATEGITATRRERTTLRRQRVTRPKDVACGRCGGAGRSEAWRHTGFTCYDCGGIGTRVRSVRVYTDPELLARDEELTAVIREHERKLADAKWQAGQAERDRQREERAKAEAERRAAEEAEKARSDYVGTVGGRIEVQGTVEAAFSVDSRFGKSMLVKLRTDDENVVSMFTTAEWAWGAEDGQRLRIRGTVKAHELYRDERQTVLTRPGALSADTEAA